MVETDGECFEIEFVGVEYIVYIVPIGDIWYSVSLMDSQRSFFILRITFVVTVLLVIVGIGLMILFFYDLLNKTIALNDERIKINELELKSEKALAASEAKSTFVSNMSHEIRTPINAILGMNEMIIRESNDEKAVEYAYSIENSGHVLLGIINDILDMSKIEAGKLEIINGDYELSSMLNDLVGLIQTRAGAKGILLNLDFDSETPRYLKGDEVRVKQIITNLLTNAVKYTENGEITFKVGYENIKANDNEVLLKVSVKDTGIGIKKEDMDKLFSEFDRLEEERNRNIEGTGLGLSITCRLLEMMGSRLCVESTYGKGSEFCFVLKQIKRSNEVLGDYSVTYKRTLNSNREVKGSLIAPEARILVVDDTEMNIKVFVNLLKRTRVKIDSALSGDECLEKSFINKYDVIFMDHMMPKKDGIETLKELRSYSNCINSKTPVICLTANAISGAREQYMEAGFNDYLTKPILVNKIEEMLKEYIPYEKQLSSEENGDIAVMEKIDHADVSGLDQVKGVENCGSKDDYIAILKIFGESYSDKVEELETLYDKNDYENYIIKVHALKSSAFIIGANVLGEMAKKSEYAGKEKDYETVKAVHRGLMEEYTRIYGEIEKMINKETGNGEGQKENTTDVTGSINKEGYTDEDHILEGYIKIAEAARKQDVNGIEITLRELKRRELSPQDLKIVNEIDNLVALRDYEGMTRLLES
ncbi:MAG: response regulator [Lachnospiraceae bacterium]|nr:response regulator [Lachnospiraceae bacterium]